MKPDLPAPKSRPAGHRARTITGATAAVLLAWGFWAILSLMQKSTDSAESVIVKKTCAVERDRVRKEDRETFIRPSLARLRERVRQPASGAGEPGAALHAEWEKLLWTMKWSDYREPDGVTPLQWLFAQKSLPAETRRLLLETVFTLYPQEFSDQMKTVLQSETDDRLCCMAAAYLQRALPAQAGACVAQLQSRFPDWQDRPRVRAEVDRLAHLKSPRQPPPLRTLLRHDFPGSGPVVISIQRPDRNLMGRAIVRDSTGKFLRTPAGKVFSIPQFARSVSNLPGHLTNGNTPQGIFQIRSIEVCDNASIGPTEALILSLPGEYDSRPAPGFIHYRTMRGLAPTDWESWQPFMEAEYAGQAKRSEILAHGTTIDPENWRDSPFYPQTPSHGCLTCPEDWDPQSGERLSSAQQSLVSAVRSAGGPPGWLIVVENQAGASPVSEEEIAEILSRAE